LNALIVSAGLALTTIGIGVERGWFVAEPALYLQRILQRLDGAITDAKFRFRGPRPVKNKIVIVEIDSLALSQPELGRWPWSRDRIAYLLQAVFSYKPRAVGLDIVFSEGERAVSDELRQELVNHRLEKLLSAHDNDRLLREALFNNRRGLVMGWTPDPSCNPAFDPPCRQALLSPQTQALWPKGFDRFALESSSTLAFLSNGVAGGGYLRTAVNAVTNIPMFNSVTVHQGFLDGNPDADGIVRRLPLFTVLDQALHPSFALTLASLQRDSKPSATFDQQGRLTSASLGGADGSLINASATAAMGINFRRPYPAFDRIGVTSFFDGSESVEVKGKSLPLAELLKDATVLISVTAAALGDVRNTPFDVAIPGVEVHAHAVDTILSGDSLQSEATSGALAAATIGLVLLASLVAINLSSAFSGWRAGVALLAPSVLLVLGDFTLFANFNINLHLGVLLLTLICLSLTGLLNRYWEEEKKREFVRSAFSRYVAPAMVDAMIRDPSKLALGMQPQAISILFSDLRGFTSISESASPEVLSSFLNEYYDLMTAEIHREQGTVDKFIGDALMAFWGAPVTSSDHCAQAIRSSVRMRKVFLEHKSQFEELLGRTVEMGIGLNTGAAMVGNIGSQTNYNYTVLGDPVNLAARIEGLTKHYGAAILTTRETLQSSGLAGELVWRMIDHVRVKGRTEATELIELCTEEFPGGFLEIFNRGQEAYREGRWIEAEVLLEQAGALYAQERQAEDRPTSLLLERIRTLNRKPPASWDGCWVMNKR
jgi:adenylate cyclase